MAITKVWIEEGCTACGLCEGICPDVFEMPDEAIVVEGVDYSTHEDDIKESAESCPVEVIKFEES
jgi:ferredoxin